VSFGFVVIGLLALAAGLIAILIIAMQGAMQFQDLPTRKLLLRLGWLSLVLLMLTLILLIWAVLRHVRYRLRAAEPPVRSEYVNAWELAGKRFRLEDHDDLDDDEDDAPDKWRYDSDEHDDTDEEQDEDDEDAPKA